MSQNSLILCVYVSVTQNVEEKKIAYTMTEINNAKQKYKE